MELSYNHSIAGGTIRRSHAIMDYPMLPINRPHESGFCMQEHLWAAYNLLGVLYRKKNQICSSGTANENRLLLAVT